MEERCGLVLYVGSQRVGAANEVAMANDVERAEVEQS